MNYGRWRPWTAVILSLALTLLTAAFPRTVSGAENANGGIESGLEAEGGKGAEAGQEAEGGQGSEGVQVAENGQNSSYLGGGRITLLANQSASQMLSAVLETPEGSLIVVDGGTGADKDHLVQVLKEKGGHVKVWLITHPHEDHIGALNGILQDPQCGIAIDGIYYHFADLDWYYSSEEYRADTVAGFMETLAGQPVEKLHGNLAANEKIMVDNTEITVMNEPYLFPKNSINNSSIAYTIKMNGKYIVFLGDMGQEAGDRLLKEYGEENIYCDILQMAHHGQYGVSEKVYRILHPKICLWPTPKWLWENDNGGGPESGPWQTSTTRALMDKLKVRRHYCIKDGDQVVE